MNQSLKLFIEETKKVENPTVLELGTRRGRPERSTMHKDWVPHASEFLGTDFLDGLDVDILADLHTLSETVGENRFDAIISCSTFEHIQYPWIAAQEIGKALKKGGLVFVQTHFTFFLHGAPNDYWRFTTDGLGVLFSEQHGFDLLSCEYQFPCEVVSSRIDYTGEYYHNVCCLARRN